MSKGKLIGLVVAALMVAVIGGPLGSGAAQAAGESVAVLDRTSYWRVMESLDWPMLSTAGGPVSTFGKDPLHRRDELDHPPHIVTVYPPAAWRDAGFDDSGWLRFPHFTKFTNGELDPRANGGGATNDLFTRQISMRGKFSVSDPAAVKDLTLTLAYHGGVVVWLNGKEVARANLPAGEIAPGAPAEVYPDKAYLKENGKPYSWYHDGKVIGLEAYPLRTRKLEKVAIPANLLRKGVNVLALEIHGAMYPEAIKRAGNIAWGTCGLCDVLLQADGGEGLAPNTARPRGLQVWNVKFLEAVRNVDFGDPNESLKPVVICGVRNGVFTGHFAVGCDKPIKNLQIKVADLVSAEGKKIPASDVELGYGKFGPNGCGGLEGYYYPGAFTEEAILPSPAATIPPSGQTPKNVVRQGKNLPASGDGAVAPIWVNVNVPKDAAPGAYKSTVTVSCEDQSPVEVPLEVKVNAWTLPNPADYSFVFGLIQSPEGVSMAYGAEPWSDKHIALMGKSFDLIGKLGNGMRVLYLPLIAETQFGNSESLVLWIKGADGKYTYDTSRVEKYIDVALKHMGTPRFTVVGVWDFGWNWERAYGGKQVNKFSVLDPTTGKVENLLTPVHGTPEAAAFWKPVLTKVYEILARKRLDDTMLFGFISDPGDPDWGKEHKVVSLFHDILPNASWEAVHHVSVGKNDHLSYNGGSILVRYQANVYGCGAIEDPDIHRSYGWKYPEAKNGLRTWYSRHLADGYSPRCYWWTPECAVLSDRRGLGHDGADFWGHVGKDGRFEKIVDRYPATAEGNLALYIKRLLYPGPEGAVPTVGYVMMRDGIEQTETRTFLEKLLVEKPCRLTPELAKEIQAVLDERVRCSRELALSGEGGSHHASGKEYLLAVGWEDRTAKLYEMAAAAAKAIGSDSADKPATP